jgi:hypothetical protein
MGERVINPKLNVHEEYMSTVYVNPYRFGSGGGGTTVYVEHDFTATTTGDLSTVSPDIDELGGGWVGGNNDKFDFQSGNTGVQCTITNSNTQTQVQTDGREDVQVTLDVVLNRSDADAKWQGVIIRSTGSSFSNSLNARLHGAATTAILRLRDNTSNIKDWDLQALMTTPPESGDTMSLVIRCSGDDIVLYSISVNGASAEVINDSYTLTGSSQTNHGAGSGADYYGILSNEQLASSSERFEYFKVESIP